MEGGKMVFCKELIQHSSSSSSVSSRTIVSFCLCLCLVAIATAGCQYDVLSSTNCPANENAHMTVAEAQYHCNSNINCGGFQVGSNFGGSGATTVQFFPISSLSRCNRNTDWLAYIAQVPCLNKTQPTTTNHPTTTTTAVSTNSMQANVCGVQPAGLYTVGNTANVYCDGNGYALIQNYLSSCGSNYQVRADLSDTTACGYLSELEVRDIALNGGALEVKLENDGESVKSTAAVTALQAGTHWGAVADSWRGDAWCWTGGPATATKWPHMYHSSGFGSCVHWMHDVNQRHNKFSGFSRQYSRTWIRSLNAATPEPSVVVVVVTALPPNVAAETEEGNIAVGASAATVSGAAAGTIQAQAILIQMECARRNTKDVGGKSLLVPFELGSGEASGLLALWVVVAVGASLHLLVAAVLYWAFRCGCCSHDDADEDQEEEAEPVAVESTQKPTIAEPEAPEQDVKKTATKAVKTVNVSIKESRADVLRRKAIERRYGVKSNLLKDRAMTRKVDPNSGKRYLADAEEKKAAHSHDHNFSSASHKVAWSAADGAASPKTASTGANHATETNQNDDATTIELQETAKTLSTECDVPNDVTQELASFADEVDEYPTWRRAMTVAMWPGLTIRILYFVFAGSIVDCIRVFRSETADAGAWTVAVVTLLGCIGFLMTVQVQGTRACLDEKLMLVTYKQYTTVTFEGMPEWLTLCLVPSGYWLHEGAPFSVKYGEFYSDFKPQHGLWASAIHLWKILLIAVLAGAASTGSVDQCNAIFLALAVLFFLVASIWALLRPQRVPFDNFFVSFSSLIQGFMALGLAVETMKDGVIVCYSIVIWFALVSVPLWIALFFLEFRWKKKELQSIRTNLDARNESEREIFFEEGGHLQERQEGKKTNRTQPNKGQDILEMSL